MAISDAVGLERISRIIGYKLTKGNFSESSENLPQRIAVFAEMNTANQSTGVTPFQATSAQQIGIACGYGSPSHIIGRILFPVNGGGNIGGIPVWIYPQLAAVASTSKIQTITVAGTATAGGTHTVVIGGRRALDGGSYDVNIASGDTATQIAVKIANVINNVLGCPVVAAETSPVGAVVTCTSKWTGLTAQGINIRVDTGSAALGLTYTIVTTQAGTGTPTVDAALALFGNIWNTEVINSYGFVPAVFSSLESFNGIPGDTPTGRFAGTIFKPFVALTGTVEDSTATSANVLVTDADSANLTIAACPAPLSEALAMEAAANMCTLYARTCQDNPQLDVEGKSYPDMPIPYTGTPATASYDVRDAIVKKGMSTVDIVAGAYQVQDFVTTYHPAGEIPPQFRYPRNLNLDDNIRYTYYLQELINVVDHMIAADNDVVSADKVIKPKQWKAIVSQMATDLTARGLVADTAFMQNSITVSISTSNPDRLETFFRYKRTGVARILSTTAEAGFNFGKV